jgi:hypothetical protein
MSIFTVAQVHTSYKSPVEPQSLQGMTRHPRHVDRAQEARHAL